VAGIELVKDWRTREPFDLREQAGVRVCQGMAKRGVLTRPIGNVLVIMPPFCTTAEQINKVVQAAGEAICEAPGCKATATQRKPVRLNRRPPEPT